MPPGDEEAWSVLDWVLAFGSGGQWSRSWRAGEGSRAAWRGAGRFSEPFSEPSSEEVGQPAT